MTAISNHNLMATRPLPLPLPSREPTPIELPSKEQSPISLPKSEPIPLHGNSKGKSVEELHEKFTQFVGEAFYGQMFKAMRSTVGKPAYFNGGHAEEVFQGQLDQTMAEQLTKSTAATFADPLFDHQFPHLANKPSTSGLDQLNSLRRR